MSPNLEKEYNLQIKNIRSKLIASPGSMHDTGCSGLVHWDDPEGWDGEGGSGWGKHVHPWQIHVNVWKHQYNIVK